MLTPTPSTAVAAAATHILQNTAADEAVHLDQSEKTDLVPLGNRNTVPGYPTISLDDNHAIQELTQRELSTLRLKRVYGLLFLTSNRENISPLHHQFVKGREVCITERPDLHLLWHYRHVYIKPVPKFLFNHEFWKTHLANALQTTKGDLMRHEADGFLRTYARLIVHESDFQLAQKLRLIPDTVAWEQWCLFIQPFQHIRDRDVAHRYHYGEIRLTRLNFWHTLRYGCSYHDVCHNYATYFAYLCAPYIFVMGAATVLLTDLQTGLATYPEWGFYHDVASHAVPLTLILTVIGLGLLPTVFVFFQVKELFLFIFRHRKLS